MHRGCEVPRARKRAWLGSVVSLWAKPLPRRRVCTRRLFFSLTDLTGVPVETAVKAVQARGLAIADIRRDDFPLPTLGPVLDRLRVEVLDGRGFVLLRGMPVEDSSVPS